MNKYSKAINLLKDHYIDDIPIKLSPVYGYRSRVEFGYKNNSYTMYDENGDIKFITNLRIARLSIQLLMPILLDKINSNKLLNTKLFQINFRCNNQNHILTTLIYHKKLYGKLENEANAEAAILRANEDIRKLPDIILERALPELERHVRSGIPLPAKIETDLCCPTLGALQACGLGIGNYTLNGRAGEMISAPAIEEICLYWAHSSLAKNSRYKSMLRFLRENEIDTEIVLGKRIYIKLSDLKKDSDAIPFIRYQAS